MQQMQQQHVHVLIYTMLVLLVFAQDTPAYEVLYQEDGVLRGKLTERRAQQEAEMTKKCTFTPTLVSQQLVKEGRVMKVWQKTRMLHAHLSVKESLPTCSE
jgi:hypothetical protein